MELKYKELLQSLERGVNEGVYLFLGQELFLKNKSIEIIKKNIFGNTDPGMNFERYSATKSSEVETVCNLIRTIPFLAKGRLIILDDAHKADKKSLSLIAGLEKNDIPDNSALILISDQSKLDKRKKETKLLLSKVCMTVFWPLFENQIPQFVVDEIKKYKKKISPDAVEKFVELTGPELSIIASESKKLSLYTGDSQSIGLEEVNQIVDDYTEASVFSVIDSLLLGNTAKAALQWHQNLLSGSPASEAAVIKMLSDAFRGALQAVETTKFSREYQDLLKLSKEFQHLKSRTDFRSNQRKKEIKIRFRTLCSKKEIENVFGLDILKGAAMNLFEKSESRIIMCYLTADVYKTSGIALMIENLWNAEKSLKMGYGSKDTMVPILIGRAQKILS